jgi:hypothetical protein
MSRMSQLSDRSDRPKTPVDVDHATAVERAACGAGTGPACC